MGGDGLKGGGKLQGTNRLFIPFPTSGGSVEQLKT